MRWIAFGAVALLSVSSTATAQDAEMVAKQKATTISNLGKCDVPKPALVETDHLLVTGDLSEDKLKPLAAYAQKQFAATLKGLKFEMTENPPKGKLAIYFFPERRKFALFVGELLSERIDKDERTIMEPRSNEPYIAVSIVAGEKPNDLDVEAANQIAVALLTCKAGPAVLPAWMKSGFAKATMWRLDTASGNKERTQVRKLLLAMKDDPAKKGAKIATYKAMDIWTGTFDIEKKLLAASLMDYFVFGPDGSKFSKILGNFRPTDDVREPTFLTALMATDIKVDDLDKAWRRWVTTGK
jgi:hypothetical protein